MTRIETACACLIASAFVLGGLLLSRLGTASTAHAEMVVNRDNFTFMTARTSGEVESVFVLDNINEKLMIYDADLGRKQLKFAALLDLAVPEPVDRKGGGGR